MPHAITFVESDLVNPPDPPITDLRFIDLDNEEEVPAMFTHFFGNDDFGWTVTFTAYWDETNENANTQIIRTYYPNSVAYNSSYDFLNVELGDDYVVFSDAGNPFDERFTLVQTKQGDIERDFTPEAEQAGNDFTFDFDDDPIDAENFNYFPPEEEQFDYERNQYTLQDIRQRIETDDFVYLGCSEWVHPDEKEILLTHNFTVYVDYHLGADEQFIETLEFSVTILQEMHWDFYRSYTTAVYLRDNGEIKDKDPVDDIPDDVEIVVPDENADLTEPPGDDIEIGIPDLDDPTIIEE